MIGPKLHRPVRVIGNGRPRPARCIERVLPDGVTIDRSFMGIERHAYRQHDGRLALCGGRGRCRECNREEEKMTTLERLREVLTDHFGDPHLKTIGFNVGLFPTEPVNGGRHLGDPADRIEVACVIDAEFQVDFPRECVLSGNPSLGELAALVDTLISSRNASAH